jgi:predicted flap endonuclease-1-like 5' DNA nuclease
MLQGQMMRTDYALYALAVVFFAITAASMLLLMETSERNVWVVSTVVLGLLMLALGYYQKPKARSVAVTATPMTAEQAVSQPAVEAGSTMQETVQVTTAEESVQAPVNVSAPAPTKSVEAAAEGQGKVSSLQITEVKGIGEKRAAQLRSLGINTIQDLANVAPAEIAGKLGVSQKLVEKWVERAKELSKTE